MKIDLLDRFAGQGRARADHPFDDRTLRGPRSFPGRPRASVPGRCRRSSAHGRIPRAGRRAPGDRLRSGSTVLGSSTRRCDVVANDLQHPHALLPVQQLADSATDLPTIAEPCWTKGLGDELLALLVREDRCQGLALGQRTLIAEEKQIGQCPGPSAASQRAPISNMPIGCSPGFHQFAAGKNVGAGTHQGASAAEDRGVRQGDQQLRGRNPHRPRQHQHHRQENHHHRGVVDERRDRRYTHRVSTNTKLAVAESCASFSSARRHAT